MSRGTAGALAFGVLALFFLIRRRYGAMAVCAALALACAVA